ncbi:MAG: hypothetical protein P1P65_08190 [Treponema sp.]
MVQNIILCDDHVLLRKGIKNWIETHSTYKVTHEAGSWEEYEKIADSIASMRTALPPGADAATGEQSGYIAIVDISFKMEYMAAAREENCGFEIIHGLTALGNSMHCILEP